MGGHAPDAQPSSRPPSLTGDPLDPPCPALGRCSCPALLPISRNYTGSGIPRSVLSSYFPPFSEKIHHSSEFTIYQTYLLPPPTQPSALFCYPEENFPKTMDPIKMNLLDEF